MEKYNLEQLVKVQVIDKVPASSYISYKEKSFWEGISEAGFYRKFITLKPLTDKELKNYIIEGKKIYNKPKVSLYFNGKIEKHIEFNTLKEAQDWVNTNITPFVKLTEL